MTILIFLVVFLFFIGLLLLNCRMFGMKGGVSFTVVEVVGIVGILMMVGGAS